MRSFLSLKEGLYVLYDENFLTKELADEYYDILNDLLTFNTKLQSRVKIMGRYIDIPRQQVAYGNAGTYYNFSGNKVYARGWNDDAGQYIYKIKEKIETYTGRQFNFVLINQYNNGDQYIGYHADDEDDLGDKPTIVGLSLGSVRDMSFKHNITGKTFNVKLAHGSLYQMVYPTNSNWKHSIPKRKNIDSPRISLTFRNIKV